MFGMAQHINQREILRRLREKYPQLGQEHNDGGLLAWIQDQMVDLGPLERGASHTPSVQGDKAA